MRIKRGRPLAGLLAGVLLAIGVGLLAVDGESGEGAERPREVEERVEVTYLRLPSADLKRRELIDAWLDGESVPLPVGQRGSKRTRGNGR